MKDLIVLVIFAIVVAIIYTIRLWSYFSKEGNEKMEHFVVQINSEDFIPIAMLAAMAVIFWRMLK